MRTLFILRGAPGSGKSTFVEKHNLGAYTVSSDNIRVLCGSYDLDNYGTFRIADPNPGFVWNKIYEILETRFKNGVFTVFDATNTTTKELNRLKTLASRYRYRIYCVDFSNIPVEDLKKRNAARSAEKIVTDDVIDKFVERLKSNKVPSGITVISPDEFDDVIQELCSPYDISTYKKVKFIGDIHGCATALKKCLGKIDPDIYYVFTGDYLDRGIENVETLNLMMELSELPNICLLEGNHEMHLYNWANGFPVAGKDFLSRTSLELETASVNKRSVRKFVRKLRQCTYLNFKGQLLFACHGGLSYLPDDFTKVSTTQLIKGCGRYSEVTDAESGFYKNNPSVFQIHGHRNIEELGINDIPHNFNLEGGVELGGDLREVTFFFKDGSIQYEINQIHNDIVNNADSRIVLEENCVKNVVQNMRNNPYIKEKNFGDISSFNFTHEAFWKGIWTKQTVKARGLFIDTNKNEIVARSYDKFFKVNETEETQLEALKKTLKFPVAIYRKENGFLGIFSSYNGKPFIATKSSIEGDYVGYFTDILYSIVGKKTIDRMARHCEKYKQTFVFEVIDPVNDPHIIKHNNKDLILLDVIENDIEYKHKDFTYLTALAATYGLKRKMFVKELQNIEEFEQFVLKNSNDFHNPVEGYVLEDSLGFMVKVKTPYYDFWKAMRGGAHLIANGKPLTTFWDSFCKRFTDDFHRKLADKFLKFLLSQKEREEYDANNVIEIREQFSQNEREV